MRQHLTPLYEHLRNFYLTDRFFVAIGLIVLVSVVGFWVEPLFYLAVTLLVGLAGTLIYDSYHLYQLAANVRAERRTPKILSLSDETHIKVRVINANEEALTATLIDELPAQLQIRDQAIHFRTAATSNVELSYPIRPLQRGEYVFGDVHLFLTTRLQLGERRLVSPQQATVPVYPSIIQMRQFALQARTTLPAQGKRRMRRLAKSYEFDQIKDYVRGDDFRSINWKATGRHRKLMVNQYEDERAQRVFCFIDKGRTMLMPFNGLSLLDYAINAALALSNVVIKRQDRAGLVTFSDKIGTVVPADGKPEHLRRLLEALYRQQDRQKESNYDLLYYASRKLLGGRSLILLFSNYESNYALDRVLPGLRRIAKLHQLVVVLFVNTEVGDLLNEPSRSVEDIYLKSTARKFVQTKQLMAARLRQNGIKVILTRPEELTGEVINQYLLLKRGGSL